MLPVKGLLRLAYNTASQSALVDLPSVPTDGCQHSIWAVNCNWNANYGDWNVEANPVTNPNEWNDGNQVVSRDSLLFFPGRDLGSFC